jgi:hypothetical protein
MKKQNALYGSLAYFFVFTGIAGGFANTIGFPILNKPLYNDDSDIHIAYKLFANDYSHFSL